MPSPHSIPPRLVFALLALLAVAGMAIAFYLEHALLLMPCPLCMTQRVFLVMTGFLALVASLHNPGATGRRIYGALCTVAATTGAAVAARHVWLQHLPPERVPACGPGLDYMLQTLPFTETLRLVLMGDGNCAETVWRFLGLSIPEQTLILFVFMTGVSLWQTLRRYETPAL